MTRRQAILWLALASVLFSISGLFIKINTLPPLALHSGRMLVAAVTIFLFLPSRPMLPKTGNEWGGIVAVITVQLAFIFAVRETTAANAIFIQYTAPVFVGLFGYFYLGERMRRPDWIATGVIVFGLFLFFSDDLSIEGNIGNLFALLSGISLAWLIIFLRKAKDSNPLNIMFWGNTIGGLTAAPFLFNALFDGSAGASFFQLSEIGTWQNIAIIFILGIFQIGFGLIIVSRVVQYLTAIEVVLVQTIEPLTNPIWVFLVLGELPSVQAMIGSAVVLVAVVWRGLQPDEENPTSDIQPIQPET